MSSLHKMALSSDITKTIPYDPLAVQIVSTRPQKKIEIVEWDPTWKDSFEIISQQIAAALGTRALSIEHVGSTSVPGLPAKSVIDVDVVVEDPVAEEHYVPALEATGFQFLFREPYWYQHRFFGCKEPYANIHVFGPDSMELVRHRIFRDWLRSHEDDRRRYASIKRQAAAASQSAGETVLEYNMRKEPVIQEILHRVYEAHGLISS